MSLIDLLFAKINILFRTTNFFPLFFLRQAKKRPLYRIRLLHQQLAATNNIEALICITDTSAIKPVGLGIALMSL